MIPSFKDRALVSRARLALTSLLGFEQGDAMADELWEVVERAARAEGPVDPGGPGRGSGGLQSGPGNPETD